MSQQHAMSAHTPWFATFVHPGNVMNRSPLAHAVHHVWVTIRVQEVGGGGDTVRMWMEWCSLLLYAPLALVLVHHHHKLHQYRSRCHPGHRDHVLLKGDLV